MSLESHLAALLGQVRPLEPLDITLKEAIGCQLVGDVHAPRPMPHFPTCAVSGYALRTADLNPSATLQVIDAVAPGYAASQPVHVGATIFVAKGTPLPAGADAVVAGPSVGTGQNVTVNGPVPPGEGVLAVGASAAEGDVILPSGTIIDAACVGLLALLGEMRIPVRPQPRVVVVSVGSELLPLGAPETAGLVYDAAAPMLAAAADEAGAQSFRVGPIPNEERPVTEAIDDQVIRADLIVVVGPIEHTGAVVRNQLRVLGDVSFDEGSTSLGPFGHGTVGEDGVPLLALPADPVAAMMLFAVLAVPMIAAMRGVRGTAPRMVQLAAPIDRDPAVTKLLLARLDGVGAAAPMAAAPGLPDLVRADMLLRILPGEGQQPAGSTLPALPLRGPTAEPAP